MVRVVLITTSRDRASELKSLLDSIIAAVERCASVEILLICVSQSSSIANVVDKYEVQSSRMAITLLHSKKSSLSEARNLALNHLNKLTPKIRPDLVGFPDDDCEYPLEIFNDLSHWYQNKSSNNICRSYAYPGCKIPKNKLLDRTDIISRVISFSFFIELNRFIYFDEELGVGAPYGAGEETKYLFEVLGSDGKVDFCQFLKIKHPDRTNSSVQRTYTYSKGFGLLARVYMSVPKIKYLTCALRLLFGPTVKLCCGRINFHHYLYDQYGRIVGFLRMAKK